MSEITISDNIVELNFLEIPDKTKYWFVRASKRAEFFYDFKYNNFIAIGDNEIDLQTLLSIEDKFRVDPEILKDRYKMIFNSLYTELIRKTDEFKQSSKSEQSDTLESVRRSSTISSYKAYSFVEEMDIGDYILVPHKSSNAFLLGIIVSDIFDDDIPHEYLGADNEYPISNYNKKRKVAWIKEISINELPDKLLWIQNGHKAIFDITKFANEINPIIANTYLYKETLHFKINVTTEDNITSTQWLNLQQVIHSNAREKADSLFQKTDVQSPGTIILETVRDNWEIIGIIFMALFGEIDTDIKGVKFKTHGPLSFLVPGSKERIDRSERREEAEIKQVELDNELKKIELENAELDLKQKKEKLLSNKKITELTDISENQYKDFKTSPIVKPSANQKKSIDNMSLEFKDSGSDITHETKRKISNL